ncbi:hypothetical protein GUITHDRAFT_117190 [Guillardia theta CCMP2712]|uniref:Uncharacterized protein n=1 Tax=Guillardia theta (strain CCMP2712) TaxID=905079 RepID=L1IK76_GUITC|nr:hypothetical protein GUITHDRAFT_117190 [Guillardia theta CCMP2712]EKX36646.1 hypothetical protein GUITHDRAFT_117190 [Guillardia theta CCMP2712]|eukprot:XP_005823626.1 hypothetical protein GUITHDRAFT_117190 [Guillardia theta CCMP2712]
MSTSPLHPLSRLSHISSPGSNASSSDLLESNNQQQYFNPKPDSFVAVVTTSDPTNKDLEAGSQHEMSVKEPSSWKWTNAMIASAIMGLIFGIAMELGKVTLPIVIREQFIFRRFIMLKMFLGASGASALFLAILSRVTPDQLQSARTEFMGCVVGKGLAATALGAFILGCGMALAGSCPGMVLVQIGSGVPNAWVTLLGGLSAAMCYGMVQPWFVPLFSVAQIKTLRLEEFSALRRFSYTQLALAVFVMVAVVVIVLEIVFPWASKSELPPWTEAWESALPPEMMGVFIGLNQILAVLFLNDTLGSSSAYMTCTSQALVSKSLRERFLHWSGFRTGLGNVWQPVYLTFAIIGALISSKASGTFGKPAGVTPVQAFFGGFLAIFGSRIASGCTSGHGLSGVALLSVKSMVAVPAMFLGGIMVGFSFDHADSYAYRGFLM